jgi:Chitin synthase N-terminal
MGAFLSAFLDDSRLQRRSSEYQCSHPELALIRCPRLYNGNLVLDCPVPSKFLDLCPQRTEREMTHMRYTAATCDPNNFRVNHSHFYVVAVHSNEPGRPKDEGYALRQVLYDPPRKTELFIVLTMYNVCLHSSFFSRIQSLKRGPFTGRGRSFCGIHV